MKRAFIVVGLLSMAANTSAAQALRVRLFTLHPPSEIRVIPRDAIQTRSCATCPAAKATAPLQITAEGDRLRTSAHSVSQLWITGRYQLEVQGFPPLHLTAPMEIRASQGTLRLLVTLPTEDYVAAVLAGEASSFRSDEALKAMAVAVRTFAIHFRGRHQASNFDLCDTTHCQDLRLAGTSDRLRAAASATEGELLWYQGEPAATYYHRSCGGVLEDGNFLDAQFRAPYLRHHIDPYCAVAHRDDWRTEIPKDELRAALTAAGIDAPPGLRISVRGRTPSGRVKSVALGGAFEASVRAERFRMAVGRTLGWDRIRSDLYEVTDRGSSVVFLGRGQGHGVGLCQAGAQQMGEQGKSYREILTFYYPGTALGITASGLSWQQRSGERVDLLSTAVQRDAELILVAERLLRDVEQTTGWNLVGRPQLKVYPAVAVFRDATGEPGWVAASTRGRVVRLQPPEVLVRAGSVEALLRHELFHMLIESRALPTVPLWFREGLVLTLSHERVIPLAEQLSTEWLEQALRHPADQAQMQRAYDASELRVRKLIAGHGRAEVLRWVERGLPSGR